MAFDLLNRLLCLDPAKRITARQALDHEYFRAEPVECSPSKLPKIEIDTHEYQVMNRMRLEQIKLYSKKEGPKAVERNHVGAIKRPLPVQVVESNKMYEPPVHIK